MPLRNILVEILCPNCFYHTHIKSHTLALPEMEPKLRERILADCMFTYECPRCHKPITFIHDFLYRDVPHSFMVYMSTEQTELPKLKEQFPESLIRCVASPDQLKEMILMLEDGLDDHTIEVIKELLKNKDSMVKQIHYHDYDRESETIWFTYLYEMQEECKAIEKTIYDRIYEKGRGAL